MDPSPTLFQLDESEAELYQSISQVAAQFIRDSDVIFLGPGTSSRYIVRALPDKANVSLVTTDLMVAHDCALYCPQVSVIVAGGLLNPTTLQLSGRIADGTLRTFFFDYAFLDVDGVTLERGYSASSLDKAYLIRDILGLSKQNFAVCPHTRFGVESSAAAGDIRLFEAVITNEHAPREYKEFYYQNNIRMYATFDAFRS